MPFGIVLSLIALLLIASFFITSADLSNICIRNANNICSLNPSSMVKVVWGISQALIAFVLLLAGGGNGAEALNAIQSAALISAFPFSFVVILMMVSFYKDANQERKFLGLTLTRINIAYKNISRVNKKIMNLTFLKSVSHVEI